MQGRVAVPVQRVHIRARLDQRGHVGGLLRLDRDEERGPAPAIPSVHLATIRHQSGNHPGPATVGRPVKRRLATVAGGVHLCTAVEQNRDDFGVVPLTRGQMQGGGQETLRIGVRPEIQEPLDDIGSGRVSESTLQDGFPPLVPVVDVRAGLDQGLDDFRIPDAIVVGRPEQRSVAVFVTSVDVRARLEQHCHGLDAFHRGRMVHR